MHESVVMTRPGPYRGGGGGVPYRQKGPLSKANFLDSKVNFILDTSKLNLH